ncbi:hypothetical protein DsansV1_C02g0019631 [Dioscorea sansibarensis]
MTTISHKTKSLVPLNTHLFNNTNVEGMKKTVKVSLANLSSRKIPHINSSILWVILWRIIICGLLDIFYNKDHVNYKIISLLS